MMNVFIVRPFGTKNGIDFDRVEKELIRPAMGQAGLTGGTTGEFIQQGNIRTDMFEQLLIADLVIADISIHNANVFYELGIRHAFRDKRTFLLKSKGDKSKENESKEGDVPFDLKTDRYLSYDGNDPAASVASFADALNATLDSQKADSPVYQLLPELEPSDPNKLLVVPLDFREEIERAEDANNCGDLQLLAAELDGFVWRVAGLRLVGHGQFRLKDWPGAKATWQAVRDYGDMDVEANTLLATIFQRLGDLLSSDQAVERALHNKEIFARDRAEVRALMARNAKTQWHQSWATAADVETAQKSALVSPYLEKSFELYREGFMEDRNHFYSGLNALAMVTMLTELAQAQSTIWEDSFDSKEDAAQKLQKLKELRGDLAAGVRLAIESKQVALQRANRSDVWVEISTADLICLTSSRPNRVGQAYRKALADASEQARDAMRRQLLLYQRLGILKENIQAGLDNIAPVTQQTQTQQAPTHVLLFTGHRVDAPDRKTPRFPAAKEKHARAMIFEAVRNEKAKAKGPVFGIAGGACGGDILFHEICEALEIPSQMYLVLPKNDYIKVSVADGGPDWVERFNRLYDKMKPKILSESDRLPRWLRTKKDYNIWQRSNLWMLHNALFISQDHLSLIALWNGATGDGPGGTEDMVERAKDRGATFIHLDARKLLE
ncbi:MAG TPA: tetratricopeptide repeat-containing protein [Verrucomicrobiae bacterium]|nr:tetratricopeptide repeat-containing protein [Verrucomicrobiae bacterium]